jgi:acyl-coenzyme A synthetase/AMP-(fatty) acid ligase
MPVTSEHSEVRVPGVGLYEYLYGSLAPADEDRTAVIDLAEGTETSFSTLRTHVDSAAGWLARRGIRKGDVIALQCPNSESFIVAAHAVWRLGAVLTPVELLATPRTVAHQITDSGAKLLLTLAGLGDGGEEAAELAGLSADQVVHLDTGRGLNQMYAERNTPPVVDFDPATHLAALPYSAGTTGLPKGVRLTHRNLVANMAQIEGTGLVGRDDADGNAFIVDRLKDIIKYKGHQVPPAELEAVLLSHPAVADVAVVGARTGTADEIPRAFIVTQPDVTADDALATELTDYVAARVEPYKRIRDIRFTTQIPKSTTGKILHHELRED